MIITCKCGRRYDKSRGDARLAFELGLSGKKIPDTFACPKCSNRKESTGWMSTKDLSSAREIVEHPERMTGYSSKSKDSISGNLAVSNIDRQKKEKEIEFIRGNCVEITGERHTEILVLSGSPEEVSHASATDQFRYGNEQAIIEQIEQKAEKMNFIGIKRNKKRLIEDDKRPNINGKKAQSEKRRTAEEFHKINGFDEGNIYRYMIALNKNGLLNNKFRKDLDMLRTAFLEHKEDFVKRFSEKYEFYYEFLISEMNNYVGKKNKTNLRLYYLMDRFYYSIKRQSHG